MKKLLLKILLLLLTVCVAMNLIFYFLHLPRFWGICYDRFHFYEANASKYNTLFIGSSLTLHQINPALFDSINGAVGVTTRAYNFGIDGACPTELFTTFKYILDNKPAALKYVFVELTLIDNFDMGQMHSLRRKSSFDIQQYLYALPLTLESNYDLAAKKNILLFDICNLTENCLKMSMFKEAIDFKKKRSSLENLATVDDFIPLSINDSAHAIDAKRKLGDGHKRFLQESLPELRTNTETAAKMFEDKSFLVNSKVDVVYIKMAKEMMNMARQKGVELIFILPPRLSKENYQDLLPVYFSIPEASRIELADAVKHPLFYEVRYSYDIKHINEFGVPFYTNALAIGFQSLTELK